MEDVGAQCIEIMNRIMQTIVSIISYVPQAVLVSGNVGTIGIL